MWLRPDVWALAASRRAIASVDEHDARDLVQCFERLEVHLGMGMCQAIDRDGGVHLAVLPGIFIGYGRC